MAYTENKAISLETTSCARLNLLFKTVRNIDEEYLVDYLEKSWIESPQDTLKIIFYNRDCRGGKGERKIFYQSLKWLYNKDNAMFMRNFEHISEYGYCKDYLQLIDYIPEIKSKVVRLFARKLFEDRQKVRVNEPVSLFGKYAPREGKKYDKKYNLASLIGQCLGVSKKNYRKLYTSPIGYAIETVERRMCANEWELIKYASVPSIAMNNLKNAFKRHDEVRYSDYLRAVAAGRTKINASQLQPHQLVSQYLNGRYLEIESTIEEQWKALSRKVKSESNFNECIVLSDVSGSMEGRPMEVSIALGILISSHSKPPYKNKVITFESNPKVFNLTGSSLWENVNQLKSAPWGGSTDIQKAFNLILREAVMYHVAPEDMPKTLFIISDMQFNQADYGNNFLTNFETIKMKFAMHGYQIPTIVFWNVRANTTDFPVNAHQDRVSMISGFSPSVLKAVLQGETNITPYQTMRNAIDSERYSRLS